ncbi:hypothetical protein bpr_I1873 [Butyrivibrio proteoclasticus B316]|uniref:HEPN/Toprim N-terminal domain-containing protein n=1 Tax=Butyrivibrio proteoclasticus (strain ATCC 51982 / DSM 14932 / B316) TaxID=515622 RepID=E0RWT1_BUTPB|nr:HEPN/Toprim-associated domain-containing protein [Butyrivibrio proteoclasticus]ADL34607.1 hypothetical protein bpr_I1873 [Butyrivibrio proteoclasticus B316]
MGEYVSITIGNYDFLQRKNTFGDLLSIFDKKELIIKETQDEEGKKYIQRYFCTSIKNAKMCLDVMGHTISQAKVLFDNLKEAEIDYLEDSTENIDLEQYKKEFDFDSWRNAVLKYAKILENDIYKEFKYLNLEKERQKKVPFSEGIQKSHRHIAFMSSK